MLKRWLVAAMVWATTGGRGQWIKCQIPLTGENVEMEGGKRGCWRRSISPLYLL